MLLAKILYPHQERELAFSMIILFPHEMLPLTTTQISEKIAFNSKGKIFKISGTFKDSLELRLKKAGYVNGFDIGTHKSDKKPLRRSLYSITPKGKRLLNCWLAFLSTL
jgi:DNA-binding PadR family transcriptional regulator